LQDDPADQVRIDAPRRHDLLAGGPLDLLQEFLRVRVRELDGCRQLRVDDAFVLAGEALELARDLLELPGPVLVDQDQQEVAQQLVASREQVLERGPLRARVELRVAQEPAQLGDFGLCSRQLL
jgi:hypothetical protein